MLPTCRVYVPTWARTIRSTRSAEAMSMHDGGTSHARPSPSEGDRPVPAAAGPPGDGGPGGGASMDGGPGGAVASGAGPVGFDGATITEPPRFQGLPEGLPGGEDLLVALDIEGTLLSHDGALSPAVHEAVHEVVRSGAQEIGRASRRDRG